MFLFWFKRSFSLLVLVFIIFLTSVAFAQTGAPVDWTQIGVDTAIVGGIVSVVQFLKSSFLKDLPAWAYIAITMLFSAVAGYVTTPDGATVDAILRAVFSYATAAAWIYSVGKHTIAGKLKRDG